ncbi:hypothetical protein [Nonomuraea candida]|nr:hypothetical protein [Nonomuraea candida]
MEPIFLSLIDSLFPITDRREKTPTPPPDRPPTLPADHPTGAPDGRHT